VVVTPAAVGLDAFAAVEVIAGLMQRSAHACAWLAAADLDANGVPHAQPAENLSLQDQPTTPTVQTPELPDSRTTQVPNEVKSGRHILDRHKSGRYIPGRTTSLDDRFQHTKSK
jgi:hypothetical protein